MFELDDLLAGLKLEEDSPGRYRAPNMDYYGKSSGGAAAQAVSDIVAGGQLLAQAITAATMTQPGKSVKSVHAVFARSGRVSLSLELQVDTVQSGRTLGTAVVTFLQEDRPIATSTVLLHAPDPDAIRHGSPMKPVDGPDSPGTRIEDRGAYEVGVIEASELAGPDDVGSPELPMWVRFKDGPSDEATNQALLAFVSNFHLIGVAMRPHAGLSVEQSHLRVTTGVLSHTIAFHEPFDAHQWLLLDQDVPYAGRGRTYGRGSVFTEDGALVASFAQDGLIRAMAEARAPGDTTSRL